MSQLKKHKLWCPYCENGFVWPSIPAEFDCPECDVSLTDEEVHHHGYEIGCKGGMFERTESRHYYNTNLINHQSEREKAFYEAWRDEHKRGDLLQMLLSSCLRKDPEISDRERFIVNTVIQWLGTNVGFGFVQDALKRAGYEVKKNKENDAPEK